MFRSTLLPCAAFFAVTSLGLTDDWPQWRGPNRDAISRETGLLKEWPADGPRVVWQVESAGVAYSSMAVKDGRVITQGDLDGVEHVIAYSEKDGTLLWAVQPEPVAKELADRVEREFSRLDRDGDGRLDELEAMNGLGWNYNNFDSESDADATELAKQRAAFWLEGLDKNNDGGIDGAEAPPAMAREFTRIDAVDNNADKTALAQTRAAEAMKEYDSDGDGNISREEAGRTLIGYLFNGADERSPVTNRGDGLLTEQELAVYFERREAGRDGLITAAELENYFAGNFPGRDGVLTQADVRGYYGGYRNSYGDGPRGTPTIDGDRVYAEGGNGDVTCLDAATGKTIWHVNLVRDLGGGRPGWGYSESPLIVDDWVIVTPGGNQGTIAALDKVAGSVVWRSTEVKEEAQYSSPMPAEIAGVRQLVQFARNSVFGVTLEDGAPLWSYSGANNGTANVATPIVFDEYVLASSGYGTGSGLVKVTSSGTSQQADEVYFQKRLANHHGGLVKVGDYVYGFGNGLMCMNFLTGEIEWQSRSVGKGSLVCADGRLYCLGERYEVALVEATPEEYREHGRFRIESFGRPSWAHPVVANGKLYIRNLQRLTAYDVSAANSE